jgi:hypothetical protein
MMWCTSRVWQWVFCQSNDIFNWLCPAVCSCWWFQQWLFSRHHRCHSWCQHNRYISWIWQWDICRSSEVFDGLWIFTVLCGCWWFQQWQKAGFRRCQRRHWQFKNSIADLLIMSILAWIFFFCCLFHHSFRGFNFSRKIFFSYWSFSLFVHIKCKHLMKLWWFDCERWECNFCEWKYHDGFGHIYILRWIKLASTW